ncbi:MAG: hypothetical protein JXB32_14845 [Deltaproteobacteria bacterium]|nr:hypothetical protein [Deltaproteobacteria bacterium]
MKKEHSAEKPKGTPRPIPCRTSDLDFDFGAPVLADQRVLNHRWRLEQVEEEHGLRADVYRALGLM